MSVLLSACLYVSPFLKFPCFFVSLLSCMPRKLKPSCDVIVVNHLSHRVIHCIRMKACKTNNNMIGKLPKRITSHDSCQSLIFVFILYMFIYVFALCLHIFPVSLFLCPFVCRSRPFRPTASSSSARSSRLHMGF